MRKDPIERLLRGLYSAALYVLLPITAYHLVWRGFRQREYFRRWPERYAVYGRSDDDGPRDTLWVHAVSVGEVNAAAPLVNAIRKLHPHLHMRFNGQGSVRTGRDIRLAITMLAWSDGRQGQGGGGQTYISDGKVTQRDWKSRVGLCNGNMADELAWVMDYFCNG